MTLPSGARLFDLWSFSLLLALVLGAFGGFLVRVDWGERRTTSPCRDHQAADLLPGNLDPSREHLEQVVGELERESWLPADTRTRLRGLSEELPKGDPP